MTLVIQQIQGLLQLVIEEQYAKRQYLVLSLALSFAGALMAVFNLIGLKAGGGYMNAEGIVLVLLPIVRIPTLKLLVVHHA